MPPHRQCILYFIFAFCFLSSIKRCGGWMVGNDTNNNLIMLILVTAQLSVSVSFVNTQIGHCLTRMERGTNIEQDKVNKESSSRNGISAPIIWSPV